MAAAIVAVAKRFPGKSVRSAHAVVAAAQNGKRCITITVFTDVPSVDVIRHHLPRPEVAGPAAANLATMPMTGRELRLVDVVDVNSPDEVGPPELHAWLHYDPIPTRDDLAKALIAHFTGHLGISTTMRAHEGTGTAQAHLTVSTAPMTITVSFGEPALPAGGARHVGDSPGQRGVSVRHVVRS